MKRPLAALVLLLPTLPLGIAAGAPAAAPRPPVLRLDSSVHPLRYRAELTVRPDATTFPGTVEIDVDLRQRTSLFWLNASELRIESASLSVASGKVAVTPVPGGEDFVGFRLARPAGPGKATLRVRYEGKMSSTDNGGLFRRQDGDDWYVVTQFEPLAARRAFPCFDEPAYKVPWQLTLHVPAKLRALANTPALSEVTEEAEMKRVRFAESKPLPSYLVALTVGPWDLVDAGRAGMRKTPVRIAVPRDRAREARFVSGATTKLLGMLEQYFGIPYPYEKLDVLAVPELGWGGMENAGLITCNQSRILRRPEELSLGFERRCSGLMAHEVAHQWFGDLVTMAWWDDLWLNEAFATWITPKILDHWHPEWGEGGTRVERNNEAMAQDSLVSVRKIRQPIASRHDIRSAFDNITYEKGAAMLDMLESWLGESRFREGVRRYLQRHSWKNATAGDFLAALSAAAGRDTRPVASTFLDQSGVPLLRVRLLSGRAPALLVTQSRYLPAGSSGSRERTWRIPVTVRLSAGGKTRSVARVIEGREARIPLPAGTSDLHWVLVNAERSGYYRVAYSGDLLKRLLVAPAGALTAVERAGLVSDLAALVESGDVPAAEALRAVPKLVGNGNHYVVTGITQMLTRIGELTPEPLRPQYAAYVRRTLGERAQRLTWSPRSGESTDEREVRRELLRLVAGVGEDPVLATEAVRLTRRWLADRSAIHPDLVSNVVMAASRAGDRALFESLRDAVLKSSDPQERWNLLYGMGALRHPEAREAAFRLSLSEELHPLLARTVLRGAGDDLVNRAAEYRFVKENWDALTSRLPKDQAAFLMFAASGIYDRAHLADTEAFFRPRAAKLDGGPRVLAEVLELIRLGIAVREAQQKSLADFLNRPG